VGLPAAAGLSSRLRGSTAASVALQAATAWPDAAAAAAQAWEGLDSTLLTAFADQGQNLNGILFQASLPSYLFFLYFLGYKGNNTPPLVQFGFSFLLLFVLATIPTGIISKTTYGVILADSDWLHGAAESLLTCTNILIVLGFRGALTGDAALADNSAAKTAAWVWFAAAVATIAAGVPLFAAAAHTPFLGGLGAFSADAVPAVEPANALSVPTWIVHWSSVFEFLLAMTLAWRYADATGNPRWKGLTWGMFPSQVSSVAAVTFHVFYNGVPWILSVQAACTFLGNTTLAVAAARIAVSNGWTIAELNPLPALSRAWAKVTGSEEAEAKEEAGAFDVTSLVATATPEELTPGPLLAVEVVALSVAFAYLVKYGELALAPGLFQSNDAWASAAAALIVTLPPIAVAYSIYARSADLQAGTLPPLALAGATAEADSGGS